MSVVGCVGLAPHRVVSLKYYNHNEGASLPPARGFGMPLSDMPIGLMPLSDMRPMTMPRKRTAGRRRTSHRLRQVLRSGPDVRDSLGDAGFDMGIGGSGAARRRQGQFT